MKTKASEVLLKTKLKPVHNSYNYVEQDCRVCAIGALVTAAGYKLKPVMSYGEAVDFKIYKKQGGIKKTGTGLHSIVKRNYFGEDTEVLFIEIIDQFHRTRSLKAVGKWLALRGY